MKKEFSLWERRFELFEYLDNLEYAEFNDADKRIDFLVKIKSLIKKQDKEFIKIYEEDLRQEKDNNQNINFNRAIILLRKRAGDLK